MLTADDPLPFRPERMLEKQEQFPHLTIVRLRHPRETERWLRNS
ncbi:hypothetical protein [Microbacterium tenebrionis]|nr:hypothetical protein [Microbacterium ihumii]